MADQALVRSAQVTGPSTTDETALRAASRTLGVPFVHLADRTIRPEILLHIPLAVAKEAQIIAYDETTLPSGKKTLKLAVSDPTLLEREAPAAITDLHTKEGYLIDVSLTSEKDITAVLAQYPAPAEPKPAPIAPPPLPLAPKPSIPKPLAPKSSPRPTSEVAMRSTVNPQIDLTKRTIPNDVLMRIPEDTARKYRVIVFEIVDGGKTLHVAAEQPANPQVTDLLGFIRDRNHLSLKIYSASRASIDAGLRAYQAPASVPEPKSVSPQSSQKLITPVKNPSFKNPLPLAPANYGPSPKSSSDKDKVIPIPHIQTSQLTSPDLHVPAGANPITSLIPATADVERDLVALVGNTVTSLDMLSQTVKTGFIPKIVGALVLYAFHMGASDIHIQAEREDLRVRYRIDGLLRDIITIPIGLQAPIVSRIKILAGMKIDEQRIPQDGRFDVVADDKEIDLRVSTLPTIRGEKVVMRLLDKSTGIFTLEKLGLMGDALSRLNTQLTKPYGVMLATGPTGSGKSTTLYAILKELSAPNVNVITLEDPVEYEMPGLNQVQIKPKIGFGFAEGLRSILRQDPNIIMVGEIRDTETANLVTHAALTGHLVLSTLHTNDAASSLPRLVDMGVEPFLITSAINVVVAQRLVRRLCEKCRQPWQVPETTLAEVTEKLKAGNHEELNQLLTGTLTFFEAKGCDECTDGYKGRLGVYEVFVMSDALEVLAVKKASANDLAAQAIKEGMVTIEQDGLRKAAMGLSTLEEVFRVTKVER